MSWITQLLHLRWALQTVLTNFHLEILKAVSFLNMLGLSICMQKNMMQHKRQRASDQPWETTFLLQATRPLLCEFARSQLQCYNAGKTLLCPHLFRDHCDLSPGRAMSKVLKTNSSLVKFNPFLQHSPVHLSALLNKTKGTRNRFKLYSKNTKTYPES